MLIKQLHIIYFKYSFYLNSIFSIFNVATLIVNIIKLKKIEIPYVGFLVKKINCLVLLFLFFYATKLNAQLCPVNIDFETGDFTNWKCYLGNVSAGGGQNTISLYESSPAANHHEIIKTSNGIKYDFFGSFPTNCPNGSGNSIKLGNTSGGGEAEGVSYEFTIPANKNTYSLVYYYAVVFQDPNHQPHQQPRLVIEATNVTDNEIISCSSFTFFATGTGLPGFSLSPYQQDTTNVWYKPWSAVTLNLNNKAGKTIKLFFKTSDCTFNRHFGYAYIDINSDCDSEFTGATYCKDDTSVIVTAPFGYQSYKWFTQNFSQLLGNQQNLTFTPPPISGSRFAVEVTPYNGYGCVDTFYTTMVDTLKLFANAGTDVVSCNSIPVLIGSNAKPNIVYKWSPTNNLSDANISNPLASPAINTLYKLDITSLGGGCKAKDSVLVSASFLDTSIQLIGKLAFCITSNDSAVLYVQPTTKIQWYYNGASINGANLVKYKATQTGNYYAILENDKGCVLPTATKIISIDKPTPNIRYNLINSAENYPIVLHARNIGTSVVWSPATYLNDPNSFNPTFSSKEEKEYLITITSASGCTTIDTQQVKVFKEIKFYVPTAFTPNNDYTNDYLKPIAAGILEIKYFKVYNRWGTLLFDLKENQLGWNGKYKGENQPIQTIVWIAEGIGLDGKVHIEKGTCVLIR